MSSSVFPVLEPLHPPAAMLGAALALARADPERGQEAFGELEVSLFLKHSGAVRGELLAVEVSAGEAVVVLRACDFDRGEAGEDLTLVPASAIAAARLHLSEAQSRFLRTGRGAEKPDPYLEAHERCRSIAAELTESEYDFAAARASLSLRIDSDPLPREGLSSLRIDALLDHLERVLRQAVRRPVTRLVLIHGCPDIRIEPAESLQCRLENQSLVIPVKVEDDDVSILSAAELESQLNACLRDKQEVIPEDEVARSWRGIETEAAEMNESYAETLGRPVVVRVDAAALPPIDDDKALEMRDVVRKIFHALSVSEDRERAHGELFEAFVFRRSEERSCRLEGRAIILPVVMDEEWNIQSVWDSEVGEEIDRLIS